MGNKLSYDLRDYNGEVSTTSINIRPVTALNMPTFLTDVGTLRTSIELITLGVLAKESATLINTIVSGARPSDKSAQVERKWKVTYTDTTPEYAVGIPNPGFGKAFFVEIGTADADLIVAGTEFADITVVPMSTFVAQFEAVAVSPYQGQATVQSVELVGRTR